MSLVLFDALFGSKARARLIRFFLLNPEAEFRAAEVSEKTHTHAQAAVVAAAGASAPLRGRSS